MSKNSLLTLSFIANAVLAHAIDRRWPFNSCEVCWVYSMAEDQINIRLFGRAMPRKYQGYPEWACAFDDEHGYSDGTEQEIHLEREIQQWALNRLLKLIDEAIQHPWGLIDSPARAIG